MPTKEVEEKSDQNLEEIPVEEEKTMKKNNYFSLGKIKISLRTTLIFGISFFALIILLIVLSNLLPKPAKILKITSTPTPIVTPVEEKITSPSAYATDSAVLKTEQDLKNLDQNLQSTDLKETGLNPPVLEWTVDFGISSGVQ